MADTSPTKASRIGPAKTTAIAVAIIVVGWGIGIFFNHWAAGASIGCAVATVWVLIAVAVSTFNSSDSEV